MPSATVAISQASEPRLHEGPHRDELDHQPVERAQQQRQQRRPADRPAHVCAKAKVSTAPSIIELPWAKLTVPETA